MNSNCQHFAAKIWHLVSFKFYPNPSNFRETASLASEESPYASATGYAPAKIARAASQISMTQDSRINDHPSMANVPRSFSMSHLDTGPSFSRSQHETDYSEKSRHQPNARIPVTSNQPTHGYLSTDPASFQPILETNASGRIIGAEVKLVRIKILLIAVTIDYSELMIKLKCVKMRLSARACVCMMKGVSE